MSVPTLIDVRKAVCELAELRFLAARLKRELFEQCCQLQRDPESVDLEFVSSLSARVRAAENRKRLLEHVLDVEARLAAVAGHNQ
jgi:hypothetical protein